MTKRRLLSALLALMLVVGLVPMAVFAAPPGGDSGGGIGGGTGVDLNPTTAHTHNDITFEPWTATDSLPTSGNYYLTDDVAVTASTSVSGTLNLCLNGKTVSNGYTASQNAPMINVPAGSVFNLYDEGNGAIANTGAFSIYVLGTANLYGGNISGQQIAVALNANGQLTIDGAVVTATYNSVYSAGANSMTTLKSGAVTSTGASNSAIYAYRGTVIVQGGTVNGGYNGIASTTAGAVAVLGGTVTGVQNGVNTNGILLAQGGQISGAVGILMNNAGAQTEIKGGAVVTGTSMAILSANGNLAVSGGAVSYAGSAANGNTIGVIEGAVNVTGGTISNNTQSGAAVYMSASESGSVLNVSDNAAITSTAFGVVMLDNSTLNMTGGSITADGSAITNFGDNEAETTVNVSGGSIVSGVDGIYHPGIGTVTVSDDASITGALAGIEMRAGTLYIQGGTITSTATEFSEHSATSGQTITGAAVAVSQHMTNLPITVEMSGGELNGLYGIYEKDVQDPAAGELVQIIIRGGRLHAAQDGLAIDAYDFETNEDEEVIVIIHGGTFDTLFPQEYCAEGLIPGDNGDGTYGVEAIPECEVYMGSAADSSKIRADLYFVIPAVYDPSLFTVSINGGDPVDLSTMEPEEDGYKFSFTVYAKNMGDKITYALTYKGYEIKSGAVSVADYAEHLAVYYPQYADFAAAMLNYGAAAQVYFGYNTDNLASDVDLTTLAPVVASKLDSDAIRDAVKANAGLPVDYSAMTVTFVADTTLSVAFRVRNGVSADDALAWVDANVTLGGDAVSGYVVDGLRNGVTDPTLKYVVVSKQNVAISDIDRPVTLAIGGVGTYDVSVLNYIAAAEDSGIANLPYLTRALFVYASEAAKLLG